MERVTFRQGDIIMLDGLYGCADETCEYTQWGAAGRRFGRLACGHEAAWRLIRRRMDLWL